MSLAEAPTLQEPLPAPTISTSMDTAQIVNVLNSYKHEGENARKVGPGARDDVWRNNIDLYWARLDYSEKASWQSKEIMPEASNFVDRWAAAMCAALVASAEWYTVVTPGDREDDLSTAIKAFLQIWLDRCGEGVSGQPVGFYSIFEQIMKLAAMKAACASVTWKTNRRGKGYVAIDPIDPMEVYYDPTGRGLYRLRKFEVDHYMLVEMADMEDEGGTSLFDRAEIDRLTASINEENRDDRQRLTGHGQDISVNRKPITITEYLCTLLDPTGKKVDDNVLCVVANDRFLIRGPEANPFWHNLDWLLYAAPILVPLSVYGRSYMENWSSVARTFVALTNLIIDATYFAAIKAFATVPDMLEDPAELEDGVFPGKTFQLESGSDPTKFLAEIDLGTVPPGAVQVWQSLKNELREGAAFNEIALGQTPDTSRDITASEVDQTQQSSQSLLQSIARCVECDFLEPLLDLVWKTALQHFDHNDPDLRQALGDERFDMFVQRGEELARSNITFRVRGISGLIDRGRKLKSLMTLIQIAGANPQLAPLFMQEIDPPTLVHNMILFVGLDPEEFKPSERDLMVRAAIQAQQGQQPPQPGAAPPGSPSPPRPPAEPKPQDMGAV